VSPKSEKKVPPGQEPIRAILRWGIDHHGISNEIPRISPEKWALTVEGQVENPFKLNWKEFLELPHVESSNDFHCVEGWSVLDCHWKGVLFKTIAERAEPKKGSDYVNFECSDEYTTSLEMADLMGEETMLAYQLNGKPLAPELGGPVRLIVPSKYAYKSPMWVTKIVIASWKLLGFWELRGYNDRAEAWKNMRFDRRLRQ